MDIRRLNIFCWCGVLWIKIDDGFVKNSFSYIHRKKGKIKPGIKTELQNLQSGDEPLVLKHIEVSKEANIQNFRVFKLLNSNC